MTLLAEYKFEFSRNKWTPSLCFLNRLRRAYKYGLQHYHQPEGSMWGAITTTHRNNVHCCLLDGNDSTLSELLSNPANTELFYGMDNLSYVVTSALKTNESSRKYVENLIIRHLGGLLDTIGARRLAYPENNTAAEEFDQTSLPEVLESKLNYRIEFPNPFPDEFGLETERGLIAFRVPMAISQAYRLLVLSRMVQGSKILEIGPGIGRTAYFARCCGLSDYTTVDIPSGIVAQACWLCAALGDDALWLPGDDPALAAGRIRLLLPHMLGTENFDVALNADSLTEMPVEQAINYFNFCANHCGMLLSSNHEVNAHRVKNLSAAAGWDAEPFRSICTIRPGYVDELFIFAANNYGRDIEILQGQIDAMKNSAIWKLTVPLRRVGTYFGRV
jgi:hypothetical protein